MRDWCKKNSLGWSGYPKTTGMRTTQARYCCELAAVINSHFLHTGPHGWQMLGGSLFGPWSFASFPGAAFFTLPTSSYDQWNMPQAC